jgi:hypothetical protein
MGVWDNTFWAWDDADAPPWETDDLTIDNNLFWAFEVDWDNDKDFGGSNEWPAVIYYKGASGRDDYLRLEGSEYDRNAAGFYYVDPGTAEFVVDNHDDRYTPGNSSSDLYPNIKRGRLARVSVKNGVLGTWVHRFTGYIQNIESDNQEQTVRFKLVDPLVKLAKAEVSLGLQKSLTNSAAIELILDNVDWPAYLGSEIDVTTATMSYWSTNGKRALSELRDLADGDVGNCFCAGDGSFRFYSRNHASSATSSVDESELGRDIKTFDPWDTICNHIEVTVNSHSPQATTDLWILTGETPQVDPGETKEYFAPVKYNNQSVAADNVIQPVATTDYKLTQNADGSGTDYTANLSVVATSFGKTIFLRVKNNGVSAGYLFLLKVRGDPVTSNETILKTDDLTSQADYEVLRFLYDSDTLQSLNEGQSILTHLLDVLTNELGFLRVTLNHRYDKQFLPGLFDGVLVDLPTLGKPDGAYKLGFYSDQWNDQNGQDVTTTWNLEGIPSFGDAARFDTAIYDTDVFAA